MFTVLIRRLAACAACILITSSCALTATQSAAPAAAVACVDAVRGHAPAGADRLNAGSIDVLNWNIQKGRRDWAADLDRVNGTELLILQEVRPHRVDWRSLLPGHHGAFAEGFGPDHAPSGVMTLSAAEPLTECELVVREPLVRTKKATLITEYALRGSADTLLVVNIHGVNFTFGTTALERQFDQAIAVVESHTGPVIFSGDFNTWRGKRMQVVTDRLKSLGLAAVSFDADHRKRILGRPLDHIYIRGLTRDAATSFHSGASDHNPMTARLSVEDVPTLAMSEGQ